MRWRSIRFTPTIPRGAPAAVFFWLAIVMVVVWLLARWWGAIESPRIPRGQRRLLISAGVLFTLSWLPLPRFPKFVRRTQLTLPNGIETLILVLLATLMVTVDNVWSSRAGLLAYPPYYDGISYAFDSKRVYYLVHDLFEAPESFRIRSAPNLLFTPIWLFLFVIHYLALGVGEWQAYTVRFWPIFLLLYLVFWLVRKEGNGLIAWVAVVFTSLLPTLSVSIRSTVLQFYSPVSTTMSSRVFHEPISPGIRWYLADLRPDLLFAVLVLWSTAPLLQYAGKLDSRVWLISAASAALALLCKPSAGSLLVLAWGIACLSVFLADWSKRREVLTLSAWGGAAFFLLIAPWVAAGGLNQISRYVYQSAVTQSALWSNADATLWSELTYYWDWYSVHMGTVEGWLFLVGGVIAYLMNATGVLKSRNVTSGIYLVVALALYVIISASPSKNYFLGLPLFLTLWIFSWLNIAQFLKATVEKFRLTSFVLILTAIGYCLTILPAFSYAVRNWPQEQIQTAALFRSVTQEIVRDLKQILTPADRFLSEALFGMPTTLQFYLVQRDGSFPQQCSFDPLASPPERVVEDLGNNCKAILIYGNSEEQQEHSIAPKPAMIRWQVLSRWVKNPQSGYRLFKAYPFPSWSSGSILGSPRNGFLIEVYIRES